MHAVQKTRLTVLRPRVRLDLFVRQERLIGTDKYQARVLSCENPCQCTLDSVEIREGFRGSDPTDGERLRRRQFRLRIAPKVDHRWYAGYAPGTGLLRPILQESVGHDDEISISCNTLELVPKRPSHE